MRKKIIGIAIILTAIFLLGGAYIFFSIERTTSRFDNLLILHRVVILREDLLVQIKDIQSELKLKETPFAKGSDTMIANIKKLEERIHVCFTCHHPQKTGEKMEGIRDLVYDYKDAVYRAITIKANKKKLKEEENDAYNIGERLISSVNNMIAEANLSLEEKTGSFLKEINRIKTILFIVVILGPSALIGISIAMIRGITKPLGILLDATKKLKRGDLDYRVPPVLKDEFAEVASSFNEMAGVLNEQMKKMQRAEQMKIVGEMAASLAHEIKNPLAGMKIALHMLSTDHNISESEKEIIDTTTTQIKRLESLIRDLLSFARPKPPNLIKTDINDLIEKTISFIRSVPYLTPTGEEKSLRFIKDLSPEIPEILIDPLQIEQVIMNIILNAIEAIPDSGEIMIKTLGNKDSVDIIISDTGIGINEQDIEKIFQPFFTTKHKGTGLGLPITKGIIEKHGGKMRIDGKPGAGTTVTITLPSNHSLVQQ